MQIKFWARALLPALFTFLLAADSVARSADHSVLYFTKSSKGRLHIVTEDGRRYALLVERDSTVSSKATSSDIQIIAELQGSAIILIDTYPSMPGGLSYCQAGEEKFLRVIAISKKPPRETFRAKIESCHDNIELASPGIEWQPEYSTLHIHWILGPTVKGKSEERTVRIGSDGKPDK